MNKKDLTYISSTCKLPDQLVIEVIKLLSDGMTIPFISRYRKEKTGSLDEVSVQQVKDLFEYINQLNERKGTIIKTITEQGQLTESLKKKINETYNKNELEDLYLPFKPKRKTKASIAREKGLEALANTILLGKNQKSLTDYGKEFINIEKGLKTINDVLLGTGHIIAEIYSQNLDLRKCIRKIMAEKGILLVVVTKSWKEKRSKYEQYYQYRENIKTLPSHRTLAIMRGVSEGILKIKIHLMEELPKKSSTYLLKIRENPFHIYLLKVLTDALDRLILPSIESEILSDVKSRADLSAIGVFASNLENLLLSSPAGNITTLGVDPGFRTGCKLTVIDQSGKLCDFTTIYPVEPKCEIILSIKSVNELIDRYNIQAVAIGNGTASRETYRFFKKHLKKDIIITIVNESGASIYSASKIGREEFPDHDLTVRGSVSIARRLQDPLSELVKIDPKSIGVGQYQHDLNQKLLKEKLDNVVIFVVNQIGVDINTASIHLLKYVSGINSRIAKNLVNYREKNGLFKSRVELKKVDQFGDKAFLQSAGFLRIREGNNVLDSTRIHPETYFIVNSITKELNKSWNELIGNKKLLSKINPGRFITKDFGIPTVKDIIKELSSPGRDIRQNFDVVEYQEGINSIEDLSEGMQINGIITNVTKFGAFIDIGVHQDGLIHISELSQQFIKDPADIVKIGDKVKVKVLKVDLELKRIQLSRKALIKTNTPSSKN